MPKARTISSAISRQKTRASLSPAHRNSPCETKKGLVYHVLFLRRGARHPWLMSVDLDPVPNVLLRRAVLGEETIEVPSWPFRLVDLIHPRRGQAARSAPPRRGMHAPRSCVRHLWPPQRPS